MLACLDCIFCPSLIAAVLGGVVAGGCSTEKGLSALVTVVFVFARRRELLSSSVSTRK